MQPITIRPMTTDDSGPIAAWMSALPLWTRYGVTAEGAQAMFVRALARDELLLAADLPDERNCGFAWGIGGAAFGRSAYLRLIGVRADCTGRGIGAALLTAVEQWAATFCGELFLLVSDFNQDAQRFYRRQGYQQVGAIPGYVLPDVAELIFWKRLSSSVAGT